MAVIPEAVMAVIPVAVMVVITDLVMGGQVTGDLGDNPARELIT